MSGTGVTVAEPPGRVARRERIVDAARRLFAENGFHATGVAQIAKESGILVGQIYRDFASKEDIVALIVAADCEAFMAREALDEAIAAGDRAAVWVWIRGLIARDEPSGSAIMMAEIVAESARNERVREIFARTRENANQPVRRALAFVMHPATPERDRLDLLVDWLFVQSLGLQQLLVLRPETDVTPIADMVMRTLEAKIAA